MYWRPRRYAEGHIIFRRRSEKRKKRNKFFTLQEVSNCEGGVVLCFTVDRDELKVGSPSNISTKMHFRVQTKKAVLVCVLTELSTANFGNGFLTLSTNSLVV